MNPKGLQAKTWVWRDFAADKGLKTWWLVQFMGNLGEIPVADLSNSINLFYTGCEPPFKGGGGGDMT